MNKLKFILPLILSTITLVTYRPIETLANNENYNFTFVNQSNYSHPNTGLLSNSSSFAITEKVTILNNTIIFTNTQYISVLLFYNENQNIYLGYFGTRESDKRLGSLQDFYTNMNIPTGATHFAIMSRNTEDWRDEPNLITFSEFQTVTASYTTPEPALSLTTEISQVGSNSLMAESTITNTPNNITERGFVFSTTSNPTIENNTFIFNTDIFVPTSNFFAKGVFGLNSQTTYYIRSYIIADGVTTYGTQATVTTLEQMQHVVPEPTYSINVNMVATITFPEVTEGTDWQINNRGWLWTNDGTEPTLSNTLSNSPFGNPTGLLDYVINPVLDFGTTYKFRQYVRNNNNPTPIVYSDVLTFTTPNQTFEVEFRDFDDTLIATRIVEQGEAVTDLPANPTRVGFTFTSWEPPVTNIQGNLITYAQYSQNSYLVTFSADGVLIGQQNVLHGETLDGSNIPIPTKEGFIFEYYTLDNQLFNITTDTITESIELVASFESIPTFTVTWRDPAFNVLKIETVNSGLTGTPPNYTPDSGLVLTGWTPNPNNPVTENINIIAVVQSENTSSGVTPIPENYSPIADLFGGVIGASIGAIMTLGTIELYGITLNSLIFLFVSMSLGLWILKAIRG